MSLSAFRGAVVLAAAVSASCAGSVHPPREIVRTSGARSSAQQDMQSPIDARLEAPEHAPSSAHDILLTWVVERRALVGASVHVAVAVPDGCALRSGNREVDLQPATGEARETVVLNCTPIPTGNAVISVDARADDFGYHEDLVYRFGRPAPRAQGPTLGQMHVEIGGHDYGRPVLASPAPTIGEQRQ